MGTAQKKGKSMKKIKKIFAVLLTLAMVLGMNATVFAATDTSLTTATVKGVESETGTTIAVNAYQIVKYDESGKYVPAISGSISDATAVTAAEVQALAGRTSELGTPVPFTLDGSDYIYTGDKLTAGTWLVQVTGSQQYIYNPAIISVRVDTDGNLVYGTLDFDSDEWNTTGVVYVKKSAPNITKTAGENSQGVQYGDVIPFKIETDIPDYTATKLDQDITYIISDNLAGLELVVDDEHPVGVKVNSAEASDAVKGVVTAAISNGNTSFVIDFSNVKAEGKTNFDLIKDNKNQKLEITYYAKVTAAAEVTVDKSNNTATLQYSTNDTVQKKTSETKHYTFGIGTGMNGETTNKTNEFIKIDEDGNVKVEEGVTTITKGLQGAEFELYYMDVNGQDKVYILDETSTTEPKPHKVFTTDAEGRLQVNGLDSDKTYFLIETKAPVGYTVDATPIKVEIDANYGTDGAPTDYTVKITGKDGKVYSTKYKYSENVTPSFDNNLTVNTTTSTTTLDGVSNPYGFTNATLASLPSTGGIGTTIFTIGGCAIMIIAAGLYFATRRRTAK